MPPTARIENISDTARWVACYRAIESQRGDALFHDPWAGRLAGERGRAILEGMPRGRSWGWPMVTRTAVMDEIVLRLVRAGTDTVLNLAAGLDMRPYRLDLPASLRWIEVDLPAILAEKEAMVAAEKPRCALERIAADLADPAARRDVFARAGGPGRRVLVITEGLLIYLEREAVATLARELAALPGARQWLIDLASPQLLQWMARGWGSQVERGGAPFRFGPAEGTKFFEPEGWREAEYRAIFEEARRLKRAPKISWLWSLLGRFAPPKRREQFRRFSGIVLLERGESLEP
jgi:methyltransferase (TIGR00027 family)